jgi:predicted TIM-barrel fold metal-dependent hydrolase
MSQATLPAPGTIVRSATTSGVAQIDVHQHLWPPGFIEALRRRTSAPRLAGWTLLLDGEPPYQVDPRAHDVGARGALEDTNGADVVVLGISSPLGIEDLPVESATPLLDAWHDGIADLPTRYRGWASVTRRDPDLEGLKRLLAKGFSGLQLPATWLSTPAGLETVAPILDVVERADRPVLVHPGASLEADRNLPAWWSAVVDYPAQLQAAWWSWAAAGRALFPRLRICFAAGAGLAPVHHERFSARGGGRLHVDPLTFADTSSYSRQGLDSLVRVLGMDQLVLGSDRPYAEPTDPGLGAAARNAFRSVNPLRLLEGKLT